MSYLGFLLEWYNWPFVASLLLAGASLLRVPGLTGLGARLAGWLGLRRLSATRAVRMGGFLLGVIGLTLSGGVHDYWPAWQERAFMPGLVLTLVLTVWLLRRLDRFLERNFPEIKAVSWGATGLTGRQGRVVSRVVSPDYRASRVQVMGDDETLHMVLCKTKQGEISYGALVELREWDPEDRRYYVEPVEGGGAANEGVELAPERRGRPL